MLSLNEIRSRAFAFAKDHADDSSETREAKIFWYEFFAIFGVSQRRVAAFEQSVTRFDGSVGFIDLLWKGTLLIEHKSRGKSLDRAYSQAKDYFYGLKDRDLPRYILVCDFVHFRLYDLDEGAQIEFELSQLPDNIHHFGFISGYIKRDFGKEDPANIEAAERMGALHDALKADGYDGHPLEVLLVRLLFCLFAEDTGIFEANLFREYIEARTAEDGVDLGYHLVMLFQVLNTPLEKRQKSLDESLAAFPYVDGKLFEEHLLVPAFNSTMRNALLNACALDWSRISLAIFGSLFQSVMDGWVRRHLGAHYTRETNILKALNPLFLDDLRAELEKLRVSRSTARTKQLKVYLDKLAHIRILDPACGCGNFLVIAYRELRLLELKALHLLYGKKQVQGQLNVTLLSKVDVDQCYGIEIEEFPSQIAQVALWLTDHQMNMELSRVFGAYYARLPLEKSPTIIHGNALELDWQSIIAPQDLHYIVSNPPFKGKKEQTPQEKAAVRRIFSDSSQSGRLDYVACWYKKAVMLMQAYPHIQTAFVSTNSICQGEQVAPLWRSLTAHGVTITFCHRTFQWSNEARHVAAVHCIIIGLSCQANGVKKIFHYATPRGEPIAIKATNINQYLVDADWVFMDARREPLQADTAPVCYGSIPYDDNHLVIEKEALPLFDAEMQNDIPLIRPYIGGHEYINGLTRYCLWLKGVSPEKYRKFPRLMERVAATKKFRLASGRSATQKLAQIPAIFGEIRQPQNDYLLIPKVSSENRTYIPIGFCSAEIIASGSTLIVPDATLYHFGILTSAMHMAWMRYICGRMKSDYQYSNTIVYNNFPWPENLTNAQAISIEKAAQAVLDARAAFPSATLADLYAPNTMPPILLKAHTQLDKAVDVAYNCTPFATEMERVELLFAMYAKLTRDSL